MCLAYLSFLGKHIFLWIPNSGPSHWKPLPSCEILNAGVEVWTAKLVSTVIEQHICVYYTRHCNHSPASSYPYEKHGNFYVVSCLFTLQMQTFFDRAAEKHFLQSYPALVKEGACKHYCKISHPAMVKSSWILLIYSKHSPLQVLQVGFVDTIIACASAIIFFFISSLTIPSWDKEKERGN